MNWQKEPYTAFDIAGLMYLTSNTFVALVVVIQIVNEAFCDKHGKPAWPEAFLFANRRVATHIASRVATAAWPSSWSEKP